MKAVPAGQETEWYLGFIPGSWADRRVSINLFDPGDLACSTFLQLWRVGDTQPTTFNLDWTGQFITSHIMGEVLQKAGYNVEYVQADYLAQFAGLESGAAKSH